ncbi:MAG: hypothetical protein ACLSB9_33870 [Hydrogeniiclostridium mannosilyticum]
MTGGGQGAFGKIKPERLAKKPPTDVTAATLGMAHRPQQVGEGVVHSSGDGRRNLRQVGRPAAW